ncbi:two-component system, chemotaxis family, response regulator CheV [Allopseudospirillum japonicum]|uniref:Two-component system, chemotaxis family, response regulator CheV n=1 Tax=Allopseudospirillum japonicum TaxID=64971 RepID=A0A1H6QZR6_9GAMM|nr:chemotaxis protein CheV [Allopseudospirillum japonicum]SEI44950.1 two-component system, chemotaxis family, response regulator CheV [Allopseudospirillum japonicum]
MSDSAGKLSRRARLVGGNRMELLLFRLRGKQLYGINVFKVKEIIPCPPLTAIPNHNPIVRGVAHVRDGTISIIDMGMAIRQPAMENPRTHVVIITEYNRRIQGFLVQAVDRIINVDWADVHPPPEGVGRNNYLSAVTEVKGELIEIIDVEKIIDTVNPIEGRISEGVIGEQIRAVAPRYHILLVDDSSVARHQVERCLDEIGIQRTSLSNGKEALEFLENLIQEGIDINQEFLMLISDIEMPEMDGYTLTAKIKRHPQMQTLPVLLHSSLSGIFNEAMVKKVGADYFLAKYDADELANHVLDRIRQLEGIPQDA